MQADARAAREKLRHIVAASMFLEKGLALAFPEGTGTKTFGREFCMFVVGGVVVRAAQGSEQQLALACCQIPTIIPTVQPNPTASRTG